MRKLLVTKSYIQISSYGMEFELILGLLFDKCSHSMSFYELGHVTFSKNVFWSVDCTLSFYQIHYVQTST